MDKIEDIILRHSKRGMQKLRPHMDIDYCRLAAEEILSWKRGIIFLTTGFYVAGFPETDGPAGTAVLASALREMGFHPVIVTESAYAGLFTIRDFDVVPVDIGNGEQYCRQLVRDYQPVGMISVERCGLNTRNDYENMCGISIREHNAPADILFRIAPEFFIKTIGIGDGGNEIGMGVLADIIERELNLSPCKVAVDFLVIASVSNWGAYGIAAYLSILNRKLLMPQYPWIASYIAETVTIGSIDGVTHERVPHVDGFDEGIEQEIVDALIDKVQLNLYS
ncbi:DUF4392 domain-containing protein [Pectinatus sottacetonis]|uniref:DUF4392 domain-containing protein n=1 Tax=Pectinatus sottacetonis TaxID=1002795 RepID=UPI0018C6008E|nr:DUF4392 domain-containing protein [Pectinatus sottacetonis]